MAVKVDLSKLKTALLNEFNIVYSPKGSKFYGQFIIDMIKLRTRLGYGVDRDGAQREKLKPLSEKYIKARGKNSLSSETSKGKSNLTFSGQLLNSLTIISANVKNVVIGAVGSRRDSKANNAEVAGYVAEQGRKFLNLSNVEKKRLADQIKRDVIQALKTKFK